MDDREKRIKEDRMREAITKDLMGPEGKIGTIVRFMGSPIEYTGSTNFEQHEAPYLDSYWEEDTMPTADMWETVNRVGLHFDGLSRGVHMEIKYMMDSHDLSLYYKGHLVFCEIAGDLDCYVPLKEWEDHVNRLYEVARQKAGRMRSEEKKENKIEGKRRMMEYLNKLRLRWGF